MTSANLLITGGAGFIGSHVVKLFVKKYAHYQVYNLDKLTYAGNLENLADIEEYPNYHFIKGDIQDFSHLQELFEKYQFQGVIHLAAESHVDRSIQNPTEFINTNILGTVNLLHAARNCWNDQQSHRFYHISTDEVFGSIEEPDLFVETTAYDPQSPYSASKASSDHFVRAFHNTYGLPVIISNCSNNYGPYQFPEKLIPLCINNIKNLLPIPVYGQGLNVRDWLYVEDHALAIDLLYHGGRIGETYNIGGNHQCRNIDLVKTLCQIMDRKLSRSSGESENLIRFVKDRAGHDLRYAIDCSKIREELSWSPSVTLETGLEQTVEWYLNNQTWLDHVTSGHYQNYYQEQYHHR
ncbi:MAG: dTDP-glucose 4,6-dehydratase [Cyclobacteriaceae bacterium]|nr:dTDP-glucose 4,6-dehydratase [Cyclobacteriaceae bacterium]